MRKEITLLRSSNSHHNDGPVCHTDTAVTIFIFAVWIEIYIEALERVRKQLAVAEAILSSLK